MCWRTVEDGWGMSSNACVGKGGVGCLGIQGSYLTARKPPSDGRRMGWDRGQLYQEYLPSPSGGWIRLNVGAWCGRENCLV